MENNISIAMATYNGEKYLLEQLQSFSKQSVLPTELVIYDDCSTDKTCEIIEKFAETAPFTVKLIKGEKNIGGSVRDGYGMSFSKAAEVCKGDYIFFSDQDDVWFPNKIEKHLEIYKQNPNISFITSRPHNVDENLNELPNKATNPFQDMLTQKFVMGCCSSGKKEFFDLILPIEAGISHDWWVTVCAVSINKFYETEEELQYYRYHDNQTSGVASQKKKDPISKLKKSINGYIVDHEGENITKDLSLWSIRLKGFEKFCKRLKTVKSELYTEQTEKYLNAMQNLCYTLDFRHQLRSISLLKRLKRIVHNFSTIYKTQRQRNLSDSIKQAFKDLIAPCF